MQCFFTKGPSFSFFVVQLIFSVLCAWPPLYSPVNKAVAAQPLADIFFLFQILFTCGTFLIIYQGNFILQRQTLESKTLIKMNNFGYQNSFNYLSSLALLTIYGSGYILEQGNFV